MGSFEEHVQLASGSAAIVFLDLRGYPVLSYLEVLCALFFLPF